MCSNFLHTSIYIFIRLGDATEQLTSKTHTVCSFLRLCVNSVLDLFTMLVRAQLTTQKDHIDAQNDHIKELGYGNFSFNHSLSDWLKCLYLLSSFPQGYCWKSDAKRQKDEARAGATLMKACDRSWTANVNPLACSALQEKQEELCQLQQAKIEEMLGKLEEQVGSQASFFLNVLCFWSPTFFLFLPF